MKMWSDQRSVLYEDSSKDLLILEMMSEPSTMDAAAR